MKNIFLQNDCTLHDILWMSATASGFMRYLYFEPKQPLSANQRWSSKVYRNIVSLLASCSTKEELVQIHAQIIKNNIIEDTFCASQIIAFLTSNSKSNGSSHLCYARRVFDQIRNPNLITWNSMIRGYTHQQAPQDALSFFHLMRARGFPPDDHTYAAMTRACSQLKNLHVGEALHGLTIRSGLDLDMYVMSGFINVYASCGKIKVARGIFYEMPQKDVVSWTSILSGYAQLSQFDNAILLYEEMKRVGIEPNKVTMICLLSACGQSRVLDIGHWVYSQVREHGMEGDLDIVNSVINMYALCGTITSALETFNSISLKTTATWNALIGGLVQSGLNKEALHMFEEMKCSETRPDEMTIMSLVLACTQLGDLLQGKLLYNYILDSMLIIDNHLSNTLISMFSKCGDLSTAESIFRKMPERDVFTWTAIISGYVQGNLCKKALDLFEEMQFSNVVANEVTLVSLLSACSQLVYLDHGKGLHLYIEENKVRKDAFLGNALVDMYVKCGCIKSALHMFQQMPVKDIQSWNVMIRGLGAHGRGREAVGLFDQMNNLGDVKPDGVTLLGVLSACAHSGMVQEGLVYFNTMHGLYGVTPGVEHYGCIVDLLSRSGRIEEACHLVKQMPMEPNSQIWSSLLAACKAYRKAEIAERISRQILELTPDDDGAHILISNLYAEGQLWADVTHMRTLMGKNNISKPPGYSSIQLNGSAYEFFVNDRMACENDSVRSVLHALELQVKQLTCGS